MASAHQIRVGGVAIGGGAPVVVQSMTLTKTHDVEATTAQIAALASAGCEIVRVAVPKLEDAKALPLHRPALADPGDRGHPLQRVARAQGGRGGRRTPCGSTRATSAGPDKTEQVVRAAKRAGIPMRIGANAGSLPKHLEELARQDTAEALVVEALEQVEILERLDFRDFKISVKASHVPTMIRAYRMLADEGAVPAAPRRDRGGNAVRGRDQERGRHGLAADGRDRRHDPRLADRRPREGGRGRVGDPQGARAPRAGPGDDRVPVVRARQRRRREPRGRRRGAAARLPAGVRGRGDGLRRERARGGGRRRLRDRRRPRRRASSTPTAAS